MRTSVRQLKDHLSDDLRRVQNGEEIVVTSHNRPVAKLVPVPESEAKPTPTRAEVLAELAQLHQELLKTMRPQQPISEFIRELRDEERY